MAGLVPATPIIRHRRAQLSGSPGQARRWRRWVHFVELI